MGTGSWVYRVVEPGTLREVAVGPGLCFTWSEEQVLASGFRPLGGGLSVAFSTSFHLWGLYKQTLGGKDLLLWLLMSRKDAGS